MLNTNNSATRVYLVGGDANMDDTQRVILTTEPELYLSMQQRGRQEAAPPIPPWTLLEAPKNRHNVDDANSEKLDVILRVLYEDANFREKYSYASLFLMGCGSYGFVFRVVSLASGPLNNPQYNEKFVKLLQTLRRTKSRKKGALLDSYRDSLCLDLVAMKIEILTKDDIEFRSADNIQLIKEFCMLSELFRTSGSSNAFVGFPLPIEFGFLSSSRAANDLRKVPVFDKYGRPSNYQEAFLGQNPYLTFTPADVTPISYLTMELVGPNLDEWKKMFCASHSTLGRMVFSVQTTLKLMDQFLCRLLVMHRKNMVHLDLKPDNLCLGIGKMTNTVYLLDYGLSRICSDERPSITMGSRRYMSVGVLNMDPANYMMDIESWFYVLIVLLTDYVPWSDEIILEMAEQTNDNDEKMLLMAKIKKQFWGDDGLFNKKLLNQVLALADKYHKAEVPDISTILLDIFSHVWRMRKDFYRCSSHRMHADIRNDDSDLFKRYMTLRKLLLFPYECNFTSKGSCFANDKDLARRQEKRRLHYPMLVFVENGRNWKWDWDVWFGQENPGGPNSNANSTAKPGFAETKNNREGCRVGTSKSAVRPLPEGGESDDNDDSDDSDEEDNEESERAAPCMPTWMRYYLARVLSSQSQNTATASEKGSLNHPIGGCRPSPNDILVSG